jgi:DNA-binding response OmpR family regulator
MSKKETHKILVVEDEQDLREAIETALNDEGFDVISAEKGKEALEIALKEKPDLVLLDLQIPEMNGVEVLEKIREDKDWGKYTKIIVLTALDDMEKVAEVLEKGGNDYILKRDISLEKIMEKVKERLGKNQSD